MRPRPARGAPTLFLALLVAAAASAGANAVPSVGSEAPDFVLKATDGRNLRLSEFRGDTVLLTFSAAWCSDCRATLSGVGAIAGSSATSLVRLAVAVSADATSAAAQARSAGLAFPMLVDARSDVARLYAVDRLPLTLLIDRRGVVRRTWSGVPVEPAELASALSEIVE